MWASGDGDGDDERHGTFFQMLPSSRKYALSSVYAQMNLQRPVRATVGSNRAWFRRVSKYMRSHLASGADLWYQGSGATASKDRFFGFSGRAAGGDTLARARSIEGAVDVPIIAHWSVNGYAAVMSAGDVARQ